MDLKVGIGIISKELYYVRFKSKQNLALFTER